VKDLGNLALAYWTLGDESKAEKYDRILHARIDEYKPDDENFIGRELAKSLRGVEAIDLAWRSLYFCLHTFNRISSNHQALIAHIAGLIARTDDMSKPHDVSSRPQAKEFFDWAHKKWSALDKAGVPFDRDSFKTNGDLLKFYNKGRHRIVSGPVTVTPAKKNFL
jgi:hypothetical protein